MTGSAPEHLLWFTALLNRYLAAPANAICNAVGFPIEDPAAPYSNAIAMELFVALVLVVSLTLLRPRLSVERPGKFQQVMEIVWSFLKEQTHEVVGHGSDRYVPMFATFFIFILSGNLLGIIPTFESPTMYVYVPAGCALVSFCFYNFHGIREQGLWGHIKHFMGPVLFIAPFMFVIEIISHLIRPVSLSIRLYANMLAGEQVTIGFMKLVPQLVPVPTILLHIFVSFLQAFIFTVLGMVYVSEAVAHEDH